MDKIREDDEIEGGNIELIGDGYAWTLDRVVLCAGSLYMRNQLRLSPYFRNQKVRCYFMLLII
jgi:hypothetical protein